MASALSSKTSMRTVQTRRPQVARRPARVSTVQTKALLSPMLAIGGSTVAFLTLGRFVFLPYQRREAAYDDVGPKTTGDTFFDRLQKPASFTTTSKDPAGFGVVDVAGWGALGHAFGYFLLACNSLHEAGVTGYPTEITPW